MTGFSWIVRLGEASSPPEPLTTMSYSTLVDAERCPRRWWLTHARYPHLWNEWGYPQPFSLPLSTGRIVHRAIETLIKAADSSDTNEHGPMALAAALHRIGGYMHLLNCSMLEEIDALRRNPRVEEQLEWIERDLRGRLLLMREQVQAQIARLAPTFVQHADGKRGQVGDRRAALSEGAHSEVAVQSAKLGWKGIVDLITVSQEDVEITDFKTGVEKSSHAEQVRIYSLLWADDDELNPAHRQATKLSVAYAASTVTIPPLEDEESFRRQLVVRTNEVLEQISLPEPAALPEAETCRSCFVRHLCDEYWITFGPIHRTSQGNVEVCDAELLIDEVIGPRSYLARPQHTDDPPMILRSRKEGIAVSGAHVRVLDAICEDESGEPVLSATRNSEVFVII